MNCGSVGESGQSVGGAGGVGCVGVGGRTLTINQVCRSGGETLREFMWNMFSDITMCLLLSSP